MNERFVAKQWFSEVKNNYILNLSAVTLVIDFGNNLVNVNKKFYILQSHTAIIKIN